MITITTKDGTLICYNDWDSKHPMVFGHRRALSGNPFEAAMSGPIALEGTLVVGICALVAFIAEEHQAMADASVQTETGA